jgi:uncharacterized protein
MVDPLLQALREQILQLSSKHGARSVRVFGSRARGDGHEHSDIDLLVELVPGSSLLDLIAIAQDVGDLAHRRVDVVTPRGLSPRIREKILAEAVPL